MATFYVHREACDSAVDMTRTYIDLHGVSSYMLPCSAFMCSPACSGLEGIVRVWDLRSGKNIHDLVGHVKQTLSVDISPNGFVQCMSTGSTGSTRMHA